MDTTKTAYFNNVARCVDEVIARVGKDIVMGLPIAVGKPTIIANEFYKRAKDDPSINLVIYSGLTLHTPIPGSDIERRLMGPLVERLFEGYPDPLYMEDAWNNALPSNVELREIYFSPGTGLGKTDLQQGYLSSNYTHVARDVEAGGCNVVAVMMSEKSEDGLYSTGSNADAAIMMFNDLMKRKQRGEKVALLGQVNREMPYMHGTGEMPPDYFDAILEDEKIHHRIFAAPKEPITTPEYSIGFHVSTLIRDGGTFQVGFGSLADAIVYALQLRHEKNDVYKQIVRETKVDVKFDHVINKLGGVEPFEKGLYGCSEFIFDGFVHLINSGIIKRKVYNNTGLQRLVIDGRIGEEVTPATIDAMLETEAIPHHLTNRDFLMLQKYGIFKEGPTFKAGVITAEGEEIPANFHDESARKKIIENCLGTKLRNGLLIHAGFFIGSSWFYDALRNMDPDLLKMIQMREIEFVNAIRGDEDLKLAQRRDGRFINTAMMVTMLGGVVSDTLDNGQVISGVGGQYNFVSMAHDIPDARSIIIVRGVRDASSGPSSNMVWSCGNLTIPRHLRDVFVTEYGIADVRGKTDGQTIKDLLNITDSRFQDELLKKAKENHKLPEDYKIPDAFKNNYPGVISKLAKPFEENGLFKPFPYGTELTKEELVLAKSLRGLKSKLTTSGFKAQYLSKLGKTLSPPAAAKPYLERMGLDNPKDSKEKITQKLILFALATDGVI